jgi:NADPH:quinone reductase-like Zn-dependent oxidoreductase
MLAIYITKAGGPDVVKSKQAPEPEVAEGQALVKVKAAGLNYAEVVIRMGMYPDAPKFPFVPGYEFSGIVEKTNGCSSVKDGDRVIGVVHNGAQAEYIAVNENQLYIIPEDLDFEQAAAMPVNYMTAYLALFRMANIQDGEKVLIHSCAGGVGTAAVQLAHTKNAEIFGTSSRAEKIAYLNRIGVQHPINYREDDFASVIRAATGNRGVDIVLDSVGGPTFRKSYKLLAPGGRIICYGVADLMSGSRFNYGRLLWKFMTIPAVRTLNLIQNNRGIFGLLVNRLITDPVYFESVMAELVDLFKKDLIKPEINKVYDPEEIAEAHRYLESGESVGKLIIKFGS